MNVDEFKKLVRTNRGRLTREDKNLEYIFWNSIPELKEYAIETKMIGVKRIKSISSLDADTQLKFCKWVNTTTRTKRDIEIKLLELT